MKAVVWTNYGPPEVLQPGEVEKPVPKDNEVLIKVHAATVTAGDCEMRSLTFPLLLRLPMRLYIGFRKPKSITIPGQELAGEIESVGKEVERFKAGDQVFAATGFRFGAYAEYVCLPAEPKEMDGVLALKPANMTYEEAAAVPTGGLNALHFIRKGNVQSGQKVLINGAGGSIGTIAIQLAKSLGAEVTAVDGTEKLAMLRAVGADRVIDYTREDFTQDGGAYDVIIDVVGRGSFSGCLKTLKKKGLYVMGNPSPARALRGWWTSMTGRRKVVSEMASYRTEDLIALKELIEAGKIKTVIDRRYPLKKPPRLTGMWKRDIKREMWSSPWYRKTGDDHQSVRKKERKAMEKNPVSLEIDYPEKSNRLTVLFRIFLAVPILIILALLTSSGYDTEQAAEKVDHIYSVGILFLPTLLMILFRRKYPRWWFDWNVALTQFCLRVGSYLLLLGDRYPSTDEEQSVHLQMPYPDAEKELNRWLPLVKWLLALPHFIVLCFLMAGAVFCTIIAWFAILFIGRYPKGLFDFVVGVMRWGLRVDAYALLLTTDEYPPFRLSE